MKGIGLLIMTIIFWGTVPIIDKLALKGGPPFSGIIVRSCAIFLCVIFFSLISGEIRKIAALPPLTVLLFSMGGIMAGCFGVFTYFSLLKVDLMTRIVPLCATYPLLTALLGYFFLGEPFSWQRLIGTFLIVTGVILVK